MNKIFYCFLFILMIMNLSYANPQTEVIVRINSDVVNVVGNEVKGIDNTVILEQQLLNAFQAYNAVTIEKVFKDFEPEDVNAVDFKDNPVKLIDLSNIYLVSFPNDAKADEFKCELTSNLNDYPNVHYAEPNYSIYENTSLEPSDINDPLFLEQWYLNNINILPAWEHTTGNDELKIAVIDANGVDENHYDMQNRVEYRETNNTSGHATQVSGLIAANTNNNDFISGVMWSGSLRLYEIDNSNSTSDLCNDIIDAAYNCRIINNSYESNSYNNTLSATIENALKLGSLFVAPKGNSNSTNIHYPSDYNIPGVMSIGATNCYGTKSSYSNYGGLIDLSAPGGDGSINSDKMVLLNGTSSLTYNAGTSFSAPLVSGVAGLCLSLNPDLYPEDIENILKKTAYDVTYYGEGWDPETGYGIVDAGNAIEYIRSHDFYTKSSDFINYQVSQTDFFPAVLQNVHQVENGSYFCKEFEVKSTINIGDYIYDGKDYEFWSRAINGGWENLDASMNPITSPEKRVAVTQNGYQLELTTYVYNLLKIDPTPGIVDFVDVGWFPCPPEDICLEATIAVSKIISDDTHISGANVYDNYDLIIKGEDPNNPINVDFNKNTNLTFNNGNDIIVENANIRIFENASFKFSPNSKFILKGNSELLVYADASQKVTFEPTSSDETWEGFEVEGISSFVLSYSEIKNANYNTFINTQTVSMGSIVFENCHDFVVENSAFYIGSDANFMFSPDSKFIIRGDSELFVMGGLSHEPVFESFSPYQKWGGFEVESINSVTLRHCIIYNSSNNTIYNTGRVIIRHSVFENCCNGINLIECPFLDIVDNEITGTNTIGSQGITVTHSAGKIERNIISHFGIGVQIFSCSPDVQENRIEDNKDIGLKIDGKNSYPFLGPSNRIPREQANNSIKYNGENSSHTMRSQIAWGRLSRGCYLDNGQNNIYGNLSNGTPIVPCIYAAYVPVTYNPGGDNRYLARRNYWGGVPNSSFFMPNSDWINYDNYADIPFTEPAARDLTAPEEILLQNGIDAEVSGDFESALTHYSDLQNQYPGTDEAFSSLTRLPKLYKETDRDLNSLADYYLSLTNQDWNNDDFMKEMIIAVQLLQENLTQARAAAEDMLVNAETEEEEIYAQIDLALIEEKENSSKGSAAKRSFRKMVSTLDKLSDMLNKTEDNNNPDNNNPITAYKMTNYPNPFNPKTVIKYELPAAADIEITVYNVNGQKITTLEKGVKESGSYKTIWNGTDSNGSQVTSGIYFCKLNADGKEIQINKMLLLK